jgi:hypothetical protein
MKEESHGSWYSSLVVGRSDPDHYHSCAPLALRQAGKMSITTDETRRHDIGVNTESPVSAVAWGPVLGGAFAALAMSLLLLTLGSGIGLSSMSPWSNLGVSATSFTVGAAVWLIIVQWLSSGFGGYLTGRLRTKWANMHTDEVFFRDTAHGFLAWAVATVVSVALIASAATSVVGGAARTAGNAATAAASAVGQGVTQSAADPTGYYVDSLFRADKPGSNNSDAKAEAGRILLMAEKKGTLADGDKAYLGQLVAAGTGMPQDAAAKRVDDVLGQIQATETKMREVADQTRKATAQGSFFLFFSMLIGAFIASVAGALGGRQRDEL